MSTRFPTAFVLLVCFAAPSWAGEIESGLAVGQKAVPLDVKDCTGPAAGKTVCYFCRYGYRPVVAIYVNELGPDVARLIKQVDDAVERHRARRLAAFVIYTGPDSAAIEQQLKSLQRSEQLRHTPLTILREPRQQLAEKYHIAEQAALTMLMWRELRVRDRLAFDSPQLETAALESIGPRIASLLE